MTEEFFFGNITAVISGQSACVAGGIRSWGLGRQQEAFCMQKDLKKHGFPFCSSCHCPSGLCICFSKALSLNMILTVFFVANATSYPVPNQACTYKYIRFCLYYLNIENFVFVCCLLLPMYREFGFCLYYLNIENFVFVCIITYIYREFCFCLYYVYIENFVFVCITLI